MILGVSYAESEVGLNVNVRALASYIALFKAVKPKACVYYL